MIIVVAPAFVQDWWLVICGDPNHIQPRLLLLLLLLLLVLTLTNPGHKASAMGITSLLIPLIPFEAA